MCAISVHSKMEGIYRNGGIEKVHLIGARIVYTRRKVTITMATPRVNLGLVHNIRLDLSVLLMGSTSSDSGNSERFGFQLTYLLGEKSEKKVFFPFFLKLDHALSQSVENLSPTTMGGLCQESRYTHLCQDRSSSRGSREGQNANTSCAHVQNVSHFNILKKLWF